MELLDNEDGHAVELHSHGLDGVLKKFLEIPSDRPHLGRNGRRDELLPIEFPSGITMPIREKSRTINATSFSILLGAFGLTLSRLTGASTLIVSVTDPVSSVPIRIDIDDDLTPDAFLRGVQNSLVSGIDRAGAPLDEDVTQLGADRSDQRLRLVQTLFGFRDQDGPEAFGAEPGMIHGQGVGASEPSFDIAVQLDGSGQLFEGYFKYSTDLWNTSEAERFVADYSAAVAQLVGATEAADNSTKLADIRCISAHSRKIIESINDTSGVFPNSSVDELFRIAAIRWPDVPAVRDSESMLTYSELSVAAAEQARLLRAAGVREGDTVLISVPRSVAESVAVLGTLWAGAVYVGIDLEQPAFHTARIIAKACPAAAIAADEGSERLSSHGIPVVSSWYQEWQVNGEGVEPVRPDPDRLAYIAFTSGSTGEPKGVAVPHRAVIRLVHEGSYLALDPGEHILRMSPLAFDASTIEIWGSLLNGATLEICPPGLLSPDEIGAFCEERQVTVAFITSGLLRLVQEFAPASLGSFRHVMTGGDIAPYEHIKNALAEHPGLMVSNAYGPTENTTFTTFHPVLDPASIDGPIPIGLPVPGTRIYVLDKRARLLIPGAVGELYVAGEGLASGYFNDDVETDRAFGFFSPDVPERLYRTGDLVRIDGDGRLRILGRADDQVKVRGFRVELHAISELLKDNEGVEDAIVTVTDGDSVDKRLVAAVRLTPGTATTLTELRNGLREKLPSYMIPPLWTVVDQMPVTANGKIDTRRLAAMAKPAG
ncbi:amino acid adenylation domain-containing protein [Streptomyces sp. NPDC059215]|uniref:amino acid adenylation domain-containing protein n=1 Tax=Streptomyces sp. NPDC059215 TaxID=3346772 RepID=UPI00369B9993